MQTKLLITTALTSLISLSSCDDFVKIDPPTTDLVRSTVFADDATAEAAMIDVYFQLRSSGFANGGATSVSFICSLSSDEFQISSGYGDVRYQQINDNEIQPNNVYTTSLWTRMYTTIYKVNAVIEGITASSTISDNMRRQLLGEAKFIRAFTFFYLTNLWGDVPMVLTTDYVKNNSIARSPVSEVYQQILLDLKESETLLPDTYDAGGGQRVRATKWAATALLARIYLYLGEWSNAETAASTLINNTTLFELEKDLSKIYRTTSREPILQLWSNQWPADRSTFEADEYGPVYGSFWSSFVNGFESGDQRWTVWGKSVEVGNETFYYEYKYTATSNPPVEYTTILRLAEQYLIRAEARVNQGKLSEASTDINVIRARAGLAKTSATTVDELISAIMLERRSEFVTEWGHRWLDLKRTGKINSVLSALKPGWSAEDALYPIPEIQLINDPFVTQNPQGK